MEYRTSLSEILQTLASKGYRLADEQIAAFPDEPLQSDDWRLDSVQRVLQEQGKTLVIAVSSTRRHMKLVFVEILSSFNDFLPITLLRRLFPMEHHANFQLGTVKIR